MNRTAEEVARRVSGVFPPVVTPFDAGGAVDMAAFETNLDAYSVHDLAGILVLGSNGEAASLDEDEKLALVRAARRRVAPDRLLLVGTGLESARGTVALTRKAADLGADAALVLTPHYYRARMSLEALRRYYDEVATASPIPVMLYSVPQFTGLAFPPGLAALAGAHDNVAGMKESSGDLGLLGSILEQAPSGFAVACGSAPVLYPALCLGAVAGILAVACCAPSATAALFRAARSGDHDEARRLQAALSPLARAVTTQHGVAGLKAAMDAAGFRGGQPRLPLLACGAAERAALASLLGALDPS